MYRVWVRGRSALHCRAWRNESTGGSIVLDALDASVTVGSTRLFGECLGALVHSGMFAFGPFSKHLRSWLSSRRSFRSSRPWAWCLAGAHDLMCSLSARRKWWTDRSPRAGAVLLKFRVDLDVVLCWQVRFHLDFVLSISICRSVSIFGAPESAVVVAQGHADYFRVVTFASITSPIGRESIFS